MKKNVLLLSLLFCLTGITSSAADDEQFIPLQVLDNPPGPGKTHRASAYIPIQVYYDELTSSVGTTAFPVDCDNGIYQIVLLLSNGARYVGSFGIGTF